jgi:hypothetical protein
MDAIIKMGLLIKDIILNLIIQQPIITKHIVQIVIKSSNLKAVKDYKYIT